MQHALALPTTNAKPVLLAPHYPPTVNANARRDIALRIFVLGPALYNIQLIQLQEYVYSTRTTTALPSLMLTPVRNVSLVTLC